MAAEWAGAAIDILVDTSWRIAALPLLVWIVLASLRVRSSAVRHRAWTATLAAMLLMPILPGVVPSVAVPVPSVASLVSVDAAPGAFIAADETRATPTRPAPVASGVGETRAEAPPVTPQPRVNRTVSLAQALLVIYLAGALWFTLRLAFGWTAAIRLLRRASAIDAGGVAGIVESAAVSTPMTVGVFAPRIVLPLSHRTWPSEKLRAVVAHERAHVERLDPLVAFAAHVNRCLFWFHPASWWIERRLAADAEHACDDAAVAAVGRSRDYAEILLDMAEIVRQNGGRIVRPALGVDGSGLLGRRIDRILSGKRVEHLSRLRIGAVAVGCAAAVTAVVACRQQQAPPAPLRENAEVARTIAEQEADQEFYKAAAAMSAAEVAALEASLKQRPDDVDGWRKLKAFYVSSGHKTFGWNDMIARRKPQVLRLIEQMPENRVAVWKVSPTADRAAHAAASAAWRAQAAMKDATARTLSNAADFFVETDRAEAERLLLRAQALDPDGRTLRSASATATTPYWPRRLGEFYGRSIVGLRSPQDGRPTTALGGDAYANEVFVRLLASNDATLVAGVASWVVRASYFDPARQALGKQLVDRALQIDPASTQVRQVQLLLGEQVRRQHFRDRQTEPTGLSAVESLPEDERPIALVEIAERGYMTAESLPIRRMDEAQTWWERSRKAAQEALARAEKFRGRPDYGAVLYRARVALALHALREEDREESVRLMGEAAGAPASESLALRPAYELTLRLVNYLLKEGERTSVADFLEKSAGLMTSERDRLLKDAAAIRAGEMPSSYQYTFTNR